MQEGKLITEVRSAMESRAARVILIDDDPQFGALFSAVAQEEGFPLQVFQSIEQIGSFAGLRDYDVAVLDYYLYATTGIEIAEYLDTFFRSGIDVILISGHDVADIRDHSNARWPACIQRYVNKNQGIDAILDAIRDVLRARGRLGNLCWQ